jgi:uncharacterized protein YtpQ (UPF0354 family)
MLIAAVVLMLFPGCSKSNLITTTQFTTEFAEELRQASPGLKVSVLGNLQLQITAADGSQSTSYLDNAYNTYKQDPKLKPEIMQRFAAAMLDTVASMGKSEELDRKLIVPVIKDRAWLADARKALMDRGAKEVPENVYEDLNPDLIILYAEDSPKHIRYLVPKDLEKAQIARKELRRLACENLKRLLPKIERQGEDGLFMLTAGGDYEASLLLFDSIWTDMKQEVRGDVVVAIPSRDVLMVTGSKDAKGIEKVKEIVQKTSADSPYRITTKFFVFRNGKLEEFKR